MSTNHQITIAQANALITRYDNNRAGIIAGNFKTADPLSKSQTFERTEIEALLGQEGCVGLRCYFGMYDENSAPDSDHAGKIVLVLCGVDSNGNDLNLSWSTTVTGQIILENGQMCPPFCSASSQINNL